MNYTGIAIGSFSFFIIGVFHPIVIKCEYYFSEKVWPVFLIAGPIVFSFVCAYGWTGFVCLAKRYRLYLSLEHTGA